MLRLFFASWMLISGAFSFEIYPHLDLQLNIDPIDIRSQSHLNVLAPTVLESKNGSYIFTPEASIYVNSNSDFGLSMAKKISIFNDLILGGHVFYDRSQISGYTFQQGGFGLNLVADKVDFTANYYHPITQTKFGELVISPNRWIDSEVLFKTENFKIGTGPTYNIDMNHLGLHSRLILPFENFTLSLGGICGDSGFSQGFLSLSFNLMKKTKSNVFHNPIHHTKKCNVSIMGNNSKSFRKVARHIQQSEKTIALPKSHSEKEQLMISPLS